MPNRTEKRLAREMAKQLAPDAPFMTRCMLLPARMRLMSLNDEPLTTHEDVMALFDRTIGHLALLPPQILVMPAKGGSTACACGRRE